MWDFMTKTTKLYERIKNNPHNISFEDIRKLLEFYGFELLRQSSGTSHFVFFKAGCGPITVPFRRPLKSYVVKSIIKILDECIDMDEVEGQT
jgi:hypothetical protein